MKTAIVVAVVVVAVLAVVALTFLRKAGYRGAVGFKNRHASELAAVRLTGFSEPVECRTLARGEHSFNFIGRQDIPTEVQIVWRFVSETEERTARVSLTGVPKDAVDGELFFVLSSDGSWTVEYASTLQLDKLQRGER
jgi:hypothetical protein